MKRIKLVVAAAAVMVAMALGVGMVSFSFGVQEAEAAKHKTLPPYTVKVSGTSNANQLNTASASCDPGDQATGGGFEGVNQNATQIKDSSPFSSIDDPALVDTWTVDYVNGANADAVAAIVVCRDRSPKHT